MLFPQLDKRAQAVILGYCLARKSGKGLKANKQMLRTSA